MPKKQDLTGKIYTYWTVLKDSGTKTNDGDTYWTCQCKCGTIRNVAGGSLRRGKSKSCGCYKKDHPPKVYDLINQKFDNLFIIEKTNKRDSSGSVIWKCKCDCGNICYRSTANLTRKNMIHSCGCYNIKKLQKQCLNLIGQKFGKLTVIRKTDQRKNKKIVWECKCDCGNICFKTTQSLTSGNVHSCGCITRSIGEYNIQNILKQNNIPFKSEWTTKEIDYKRFDFAILDNNNKVIRLIEFDGKQHYDNISGIWNSPESLAQIQQRDKEKNEYALSHNIPLVRIPYWKRDDITLDMLMGDKYLIHKTI